VTSILSPILNATETTLPPLSPTSTPVTVTSDAPTTTPEVTDSTPVGTATSQPPPPISNTTESATATDTGSASVTEVPPTTTAPTATGTGTETTQPTVTSPPETSTNGTVSTPPVTETSAPPPISVAPGNVTSTANNTATATEGTPTTTNIIIPSSVTSVAPLTTLTNSEPWLPTTIVVDPTTATTGGALAPTASNSIPPTFPGAITPDSGTVTQPIDTTVIQIGFLQGYNYPFVVDNTKAAAQLFQLLPEALTFTGKFPSDKVQVIKLIPALTGQTLGYISTLAICTYPTNMIDSLRIDIKIPSSLLYNNPDKLIYNLTQQINPAIDIIMGSLPDDGSSTPGGTPSPTGAPNGGPFDPNDSSTNQSSSQQGMTAGITVSAVFVAAAYGAVMFIIARRYKKKKQLHRRASSISNPSEMEQTARGSPALMGGALLSRDFTSSYGGVAGGRDSHDSGRSGMGNSGRTKTISAPVAAGNSLGWN
ncbi:hypothetical protein B0T26DRAFT_648018, partial [Lasiosphaeria miniovina]